MTLQGNRERGLIDRRKSLGDQMLSWLTGHRTLIAAFALRGVGILAGLALTFMLGRFLGASATGTYALVAQTCTFLGALGLLGLDFSAVRHFSRSPEDRRPIAVAAFLKVTGTSLVILGSLALVIVFGGDTIWLGLFGDVVGQEFAVVVSFILIVRGLSQLLGGILRSQRRIMMGIAVALVITPVFTAAALASGMTSTVHEILWATAIGGGAAITIGLITTLRDVSTGSKAIEVPMRRILGTSLPLWGAGITLVFGEWYALAVVARTLSTFDAGLFRVATQISGTLMIITTTISSVFMPQISGAFHSGDRVGVARLAQIATRSSLALALPLVLAIVTASVFFLPMIGEEFVAAMPLVVILLSGQLLIALLGPSGLVLSMSGHERLSLLISIVATGVLLVSAPLAAMEAGVVGVAICVSLILAGRNFAAFIFVRNRLGISIWTGSAIRPERAG